MPVISPQYGHGRGLSIVTRWTDAIQPFFPSWSGSTGASEISAELPDELCPLWPTPDQSPDSGGFGDVLMGNNGVRFATIATKRVPVMLMRRRASDNRGWTKRWIGHVLLA